MIKFFLRRDKNWAVFLCGVLTNIPASALFCFRTYGKTCWDHAYFWILIVTIVLSGVMLFCAFKFAIKLIAVKEKIESDYGEDRINYIIEHQGSGFIDGRIETVEKRIEKKLSNKNDEDVKYLKKWKCFLWVSLSVLLLSIIFIWVMNGLFID